VIKAKKSVLTILVTLTFFILSGFNRVAASSPLSKADSIASNENISGKHKNTTACANFETPYTTNISIGAGPGICPLLDPGSISYGYGISFRILFTKHWNIAFYYDFFKTNIMNLGYRRDNCAGSSVLYTWVDRPYKKHAFVPYIFSGVSFSNNKVYSYEVYTYQDEFDKNSPWFNLGYEEDYNINTRFSIALEGLYGLPLSTHPVSEIIHNGDLKYMIVTTKPGFNNGGFFVIFSLNYKLL
jgi:hypothetical protein